MSIKLLEHPLSQEQFSSVKEGVVKAYKRYGDATQDPYKVIDTLDSKLVFMSEDSSTGIVCDVLVDDFGDLYLFVLASYSLGSAFKAVLFFDELSACAKWVGCKYIEANSGRFGWAKVLRGVNVQVTKHITYRVEL